MDKQAGVSFDSLIGPVHFIGIGGIGMSALARLLLARGVKVSGSDKQPSEITGELAALGAKIYVGHQSAHAKEAGAVVVSTAITTDNPELKIAQEKGLSIWHRSQVLTALTRGKKLIAISGTHGKTTTTGMVSQVLLGAALDPSVVVGGIFHRIGSNSHAGQGEYFVAESDESDGTHAHTESYISVVTNVEADHLENYPGGIEQIKVLMAEFANNASRAIVLCLDDLGCRTLLPLIDHNKNKKLISYGTKSKSPDAVYTYESVDQFQMRVFERDLELGIVTLSVPGEHNKLNALAACAVARQLDVDFPVIASSLESFRGVDRRFQIIGETASILVVDDYAHHPTEVAALLSAARSYMQAKKNYSRLVIVFQPHQPSRLRDLWKEFCGCFKEADTVFIADIYVARGGQIEGVSSERFVKELDHKDGHHLAGPASGLGEKLAPLLKPHDLILTVGAGDITTVGPKLLKQIKRVH